MSWVRKVVTGIILFSCSIVTGQSYQQYIQLGDIEFEKGDYYTASLYYHNALQLDSSDLVLALKYAESNRLNNNYFESLYWYEYILKNDVSSGYSENLYWVGVLNKNIGNYQQAIKNFKKFTELVSDTSKWYQRAKNEIGFSKKALEILEDTISVKIQHLDDKVNSPFNDFAPIMLGSKHLYYSSLRPIAYFDAESIMDNVFQSKIYHTKLSVTGFSEGEDWVKPFTNKKHHSAHLSFSENRQRVYFTRCFGDNVTKLQCKIYVCEKKNGRWQDPELLDEKINVEGFTTTQPFYVEFEDYDVLYYVSDRPGGIGGLDIWYSIVKDGNYQTPSNLGSIVNTPGEEVSPFYLKDSSRLYFSSDWHPGLGGFDIFYSDGALNKWNPPNNIGFPLNSSSNDLYFVVNNDPVEGFFSSNRPGSIHQHGITCCNDIYYYEWLPVEPELVDTVPEKDTVIIEEKVRKLLPLTLYFHNDVPDPKSKKPTTAVNYKQTLETYFELKEKYKKEYSRGLKRSEKPKAEADIEDFFDSYVAKGFQDLEAFAALLMQDLSAGNVVKIKIKGFTSPLNTAEYNLNLAKRRIISLVNYLKEYENGLFVPYLKGTAENGGKLLIYEEPLGESMSKPFVSDNPNDKRNSIYSKAAALERRIQIIMYSSGEDVENNVGEDEFLEEQLIIIE